jgi:hypothetical protein
MLTNFNIVYILFVLKVQQINFSDMLRKKCRLFGLTELDHQSLIGLHAYSCTQQMIAHTLPLSLPHILYFYPNLSLIEGFIVIESMLLTL